MQYATSFNALHLSWRKWGATPPWAGPAPAVPLLPARGGRRPGGLAGRARWGPAPGGGGLGRRWVAAGQWKRPCRVGREVSHPGPSPDPYERISPIRLFRRCGSWRRSTTFCSPGDLVSKSRRWTWVPSEGPPDTGRLCSAGSRCHPVPRRPRSYAALRLPAPIRHGAGSPCRWPTSMRALVLCLEADDTCARHVSCVGDGSPALRQTGMARGEARASQVPGPSSSYVPWSNPPPDTPLSSPTSRRGRCGLQVIQHPGHPGR